MNLRTYVDDWKLFAQGLRRREAAKRAAAALRAARAEPEATSMASNVVKPALLEIRGSRINPPSARGLQGSGVKYPKVDDALGANRKRPAQQGRVAKAANAAHRVARLPMEWQGRARVAAALSRA